MGAGLLYLAWAEQWPALTLTTGLMVIVVLLYLLSAPCTVITSACMRSEYYSKYSEVGTSNFPTTNGSIMP